MGVYTDSRLKSRAKVMKSAHQIAYGFIIFFIIDRLSRLISAQYAISHKLNDLEMERLRCAIELVALVVAFVFFQRYLEKQLVVDS